MPNNTVTVIEVVPPTTGQSLGAWGTAHFPVPSLPLPPSPGNIVWQSNILSASEVLQNMNVYQALVSQDQKAPRDTSDKEQYYNRKVSALVAFRHGMHPGEIGLEIECEGKNLFTSPFQWWICHSDGSLRETAGHLPIEYVLRSPIPRSEVHEALVYLDAKLKECNSQVIKSQRTSVHVHVNCQAMTLREVYTYLCLYIIFEELLVEWSGPERAGNLFCLRAKDSEFYISMLESVLKTNSLKQWREDYRYAACNVASITKFGSLEFRSMQGTVDISLIELWVRLLLVLKDKSLEYDNPIEIVEDFVNIGPLPFFKKIFTEEFRELFETDGLSGKLWDGLRLMRDVAYSCNWEKPLAKKKRKKSLK